jgi:hypothetical protein
MVVQQSYRHTRVRPLKSQTRLIILNISSGSLAP